MADLPDIQSTAQLGNIPGVQQPTTSPAAFGAGLGQGLERTGQDVAHAAMVMQQRENERAVEGVTQRINEWTENKLNGSTDDSGQWNPGYLQREGADAKGVTRQFRAEAADASGEWLSGLTTQQQLAARHVINHRMWFANERISGHEAIQMRKASYESANETAQSFVNTANGDPTDDHLFEDSMKQASVAYNKAASFTGRPLDLPVLQAKMVSNRATVLMDHGAQTDDPAQSQQFFAKAQDVLSNDARLDEVSKAKLGQTLLARQSQWDARQKTREATALKLQVQAAKDGANVGWNVAAQVGSGTIQPDEGMAKLTPLFQQGLDNQHELYEAQTAIQTAAKNATKKSDAFPQYSRQEDVRTLGKLIGGDPATGALPQPGKAFAAIEAAADNGGLSQSDYEKFKSETTKVRSSQVKLALAQTVDKYFELDGTGRLQEKGQAPTFNYLTRPLTPEEQKQPLGTETQHWREGVQQAAKPHELFSVVSAVDDYCQRHPNADPKEVMTSVLRPKYIETAKLLLPDRVKAILGDSLTGTTSLDTYVNRFRKP